MQRRTDLIIVTEQIKKKEARQDDGISEVGRAPGKNLNVCSLGCTYIFPFIEFNCVNLLFNESTSLTFAYCSKLLAGINTIMLLLKITILTISEKSFCFTTLTKLWLMVRSRNFFKHLEPSKTFNLFWDKSKMVRVTPQFPRVVFSQMIFRSYDLCYWFW